MKRVLVTGATGFVGRHCLSALASAGFEVHAVSRQEGDPGLEPDVTWHTCDLLDATPQRAVLERARPTHVLHLAWFVKHGVFWNAPENLDWVRATLQFFQAAAELGVKRFLGVGTCAEYDPAAGDCDEVTSPLAPNTLYGSCKQAAGLCLLAAAPHLEISCAWARLFFPYGPYEQPARLVPSVIKSLLAGQPARCSPGTQIRDFIHIRDVAAALTAILSSDVEGPINVGTGRGVEVREVVTTIGALLERPDLIRLGALPMRPGDPARWVARTTRLNKEVGWKPSVSLEEGLRGSIAWCREELET